MNLAASESSLLDFKAVTGSVLLHGAIFVWLFSSVKPVMDEMPLLAMEVSLISALPEEILKPEENPLAQPPKPEIIKKNKPATEALKVRKNEAAQPDTEEKTVGQEKTSANLESESRQAVTDGVAKVITSEPVFDAEYLRNPPPEYPSQARRRSIEGMVLLEVVVTESGQARYVRVSQSSGYSMLDAAAKEAVSRWKFVPAKSLGSAVEATVIVPIEFKLG